MTVDLDNEPRPPAVTPPVAVDGRHARSERSRQAMVDALLDLLRSGTLRPSSAQIAERAGVTQRTLFNQFGDMDSLISAVAARQSERVLNLLPSAGDGTLEERVANYSEGLEVLLEETMNVRWAVITSATPMAPASAAIGTARQFVRRRLTDAFAPELDAVGDAVASELIEALEIETDPVVWRLRRMQQDLTPAQARAVVERSVLSLLRDAVHQHTTG
jgi:TetR/AcrR family transcriptional regulator, regulator of autoinduction and epiphytic fitness